MRRVKTWEELTIQDNFLFLKVMQDERLCRRLLELLLGISISKIDFPQTEKTIDTDVKAKSVRLDVYVEDKRGRVFDIEMQAADMADEALPLRTRYYQSMIDQGILEKGQAYSELRESYIIFVCAFDPFGLGLRRYTFRNRCDERLELELPDKAVRVFFNAKGTHGEETADVRAFLEYVNSFTASEGYAAELAAAVERLKANAEERRNYMTLAMDIQMHIDKEKGSWFADGRAKGKEEGIAEASRGIALRMLQSGITVDQVADCTGLSVEEVRQLHRGQ